MIRLSETGRGVVRDLSIVRIVRIVRIVKIVEVVEIVEIVCGNVGICRGLMYRICVTYM